jgi:hypothetical protein
LNEEKRPIKCLLFTGTAGTRPIKGFMKLEAPEIGSV